MLQPGSPEHLLACQSRGAAVRWVLRPALTAAAERQLVWRAWLQVFQQVAHGVQQRLLQALACVELRVQPPGRPLPLLVWCRAQVWRAVV